MSQTSRNWAVLLVIALVLTIGLAAVFYNPNPERPPGEIEKLVVNNHTIEQNLTVLYVEIVTWEEITLQKASVLELQTEEKLANYTVGDLVLGARTPHNMEFSFNIELGEGPHLLQIKYLVDGDVKTFDNDFVIDN